VYVSMATERYAENGDIPHFAVTIALRGKRLCMAAEADPAQVPN
jgi:hypothetical protein